jgi:trk system potassium uptake protein TrkA
MRIIVCGAGQVGTSIARQLASEGNDVTVIDQSHDCIQKIGDTLDVKAYVGFASHPTVLEQAGAEDADMIIAVTYSDEINMVACQVAHSLFNIPTKIARIRHQNYLQPNWKQLYRHDHMPIDVIISPEIEVARAVVNRLHVPGAVDTIPFANGRVKVIGVRCTLENPMISLTLSRIQQKMGELKSVIVGLLRGKDFLIAEEAIELLEGDQLYFACDSRDTSAVMALFGYEDREAQRVIIIGGGNIGLFLAKQLESEDRDIRLKLLELDTQRAEYVAERLTNTTVINGDALEQEILEEANVSAAETVIAVSNDDEVNILASLLAKRFGAKRTITLVNKTSSYAPLVASLGIDTVVNPRETTVSSILQHIRRGRILSVHSLCGGSAEVMEVEAVESSPVVGNSIDELQLPYGITLGLIIRGHEVMTPEAPITSTLAACAGRWKRRSPRASAFRTIQSPSTVQRLAFR